LGPGDARDGLAVGPLAGGIECAVLRVGDFGGAHRERAADLYAVGGRLVPLAQLPFLPGAGRPVALAHDELARRDRDGLEQERGREREHPYRLPMPSAGRRWTIRAA